jgi:hypothetical protein
MAKLSLGKNTGVTTRQSSQRTVGLGSQQSGNAPIQFSGIEAPQLQPRASVIDTFSRPAELQAPGPVRLGEMQTEPEPTSIGDLRRLAESLGNFDSSIKGLTTGILGYKKRETQTLKTEAEELAAGTLFGSSANNKLRGTLREYEAAANNPDLTPEQRREANDALTRLQAKIDNNPYYERTLNRLEVQSRAYQLSSFVQSNPSVTLANGSEIELRSLKPDSAEFMEILQKELYGDRVLQPSEARKLAPTIIQAIAGAKGTQAKQHMDYQLGEIRTHTNTVINTTLAALHAPGSTMTAADAAEELQEAFEGIGPKGIPNLPLNKVDALRKDFVFDYFAALNNSPNRPKSFDDALAMIGNLMVGPVGDRRRADGSVNDKLRYINQMDAQDLQTLRRQWNTATSAAKTEKDNQRELMAQQIFSDKLKELNEVVVFGADGLPTDESLTAYEELKAKMGGQLFAELGGQPLLQSEVMSKWNTATTQIPKLWQKEAQVDFFTKLEADISQAIDDPAARGVEQLEARVTEAIEQRLISPQSGGTYLKRLQSLREGRYKESVAAMKQLIEKLRQSYVSAGEGADTIGGSATDKEEQLFAIRRPEMLRDGMALMRRLYEQGGEQALQSFPQEFSNLINSQAGINKYGLARTKKDPGFAGYQNLDALEQDFNKRTDREFQEHLQSMAAGLFPIFSENTLSQIMNMAATGTPLPAHVSEAVSAYGGMRPFLEQELTKNEIPPNEVQNILNNQFPANGFNVPLQPRPKPPQQQASLIDQMLGIIGTVLPGAPAYAGVQAPPPIIGDTSRAQAIRAAAARVGIRPDDLAAAMSYETIGTFDPAITNQYGYSGLIQFSPDNQRAYGVNANSTFEEQAQAAAQYLIDRGVRPGDGMSRIYAAILIGNADGRGPNGEDYMNAKDANGNSVNSALKDLLPGGGHYQNGLRILRGE